MKEKKLTSRYGTCPYECTGGTTERISTWIGEKGWKSPLAVWDHPSEVLPIKTVKSSEVLQALSGANSDVLIVIGGNTTTDRVKQAILKLYPEPSQRSFTFVLIPTTYSSARSMSGRYLDEKGIYRFSVLLQPDLCVIDEELLHNRDPLLTALDAGALLVQIFDMFNSAEKESYQWYLLKEAYRIFTLNAHEALYTRSAQTQRNLLGLSVCLTGAAQNISPPGVLDAVAHAIHTHTDLSMSEAFVLSFPHLAQRICEGHRDIFEEKAAISMDELLKNTLSLHASAVPLTLHELSRPPFNRGAVSLSVLSAIADEVYNSIETSVVLPEIDHQTVIRWIESIYWGYGKN